MKVMNPSVLRATIALVIGFVLVKWPDLAINYIIITAGLLFLIPGIIGLICYIVDKGKSGQSTKLPLESAGSVLFGACLIIVPTFFADIVTIVLGLILALGGVQQTISLIIARKWSEISFGYYLVPIMILLSGVYVLVNPGEARATTLMIIGIAALIYGVFELIKWFKFTRHRPVEDEIADYIEDKMND